MSRLIKLYAIVAATILMAVSAYAADVAIDQARAEIASAEKWASIARALNSDNAMLDLARHNVICAPDNTIEQNIVAQYGDLRTAMANVNFGVGLERSKNMSTFCNSIGNTLLQATPDDMRRLLFLTGKGMSATLLPKGANIKLGIEGAVKWVEKYAYAPGYFGQGRSAKPQYGFLTIYLEMMKSNRPIPADTRALIGAFLQSDRQAIKRALAEVSPKTMKQVIDSEGAKKAYRKYLDACELAADSKNWDKAISACNLALEIHPECVWVIRHVWKAHDSKQDAAGALMAREVYYARIKQFGEKIVDLNWGPVSMLAGYVYELTERSDYNKALAVNQLAATWAKNDKTTPYWGALVIASEAAATYKAGLKSRDAAIKSLNKAKLVLTAWKGEDTMADRSVSLGKRIDEELAGLRDPKKEARRD